jgi:glycosyltransferase involved in cell wall biosynthesis
LWTIKTRIGDQDGTVGGDMVEASRTIRCAVVPPVAAPYREPLFEALHSDFPEIDLSVIYQAAGEPSWDVPADYFATDHAYPAHHLRSWQRARPGRTPIVWPRGLERALQSADPDCVVGWEYGPASLRALRWCRTHNRAYVVFTECTPQMDETLSPGKLRRHRWIALRADGLIGVSSAARDRLLGFGVNADRITVALQSADLGVIREAVNAAQSAEADGDAAESDTATEPAARPLRVLTVGRLVPDKNHATLIEAFARVQSDQISAELHIAGDGFLEPQLRQTAEERGLPVVFHGHVESEELAWLYAGSDMFALVSTFEPFGVSVREAAAASLPIICSREAGAAGDVAIENRNALLVDPHDPQKCADALARVLTDDELRSRMAAASHEIDEQTRGRDVEAFAAAVVAAAKRRGRQGSPS